jgi:hypothetical protein
MYEWNDCLEWFRNRRGQLSLIFLVVRRNMLVTNPPRSNACVVSWRLVAKSWIRCKALPSDPLAKVEERTPGTDKCHTTRLGIKWETTYDYPITGGS